MKEAKGIDISKMPDLVALAEEVCKTGEPRLLKRDDEDLAILMPVGRTAKRSKGHPITKHDALWNIVGIGHSGKGDISANKHKYLAEAYKPKPL